MSRRQRTRRYCLWSACGMLSDKTRAHLPPPSQMRRCYHSQQHLDRLRYVCVREAKSRGGQRKGQLWCCDMGSIALAGMLHGLLSKEILSGGGGDTSMCIFMTGASTLSDTLTIKGTCVVSEELGIPAVLSSLHLRGLVDVITPSKVALVVRDTCLGDYSAMDCSVSLAQKREDRHKASVLCVHWLGTYMCARVQTAAWVE